MNEKRDKAERTPVKVKNRDVLLLARVLYTMQDVCATERKRLWQQDRLWNITQKITGMPGSHGEASGLERHFATITEIEERYEAEFAEYVEELQQAETILNGIESRTMRTFVTMRYLLAMQNREVMARLNLKRRRFEYLCRLIEDEPDMKTAEVKWRASVERFS